MIWYVIFYRKRYVSLQHWIVERVKQKGVIFIQIHVIVTERNVTERNVTERNELEWSVTILSNVEVPSH